jgi:uncharacterized membrane protein
MPKDLATKAADVITGFVGSWAFVGIHASWFALWIVLRVEAFPYGLLTLLVSLEAIFLSTFVMMSQNRAAERDHIRDDHEAEEVDVLFQINQTQLEILQLLRQVTCPADVKADVTTLEGALSTMSSKRSPMVAGNSASSKSRPKPSRTRRR